ncbi:MAG: MerR family transcriptional regulator [Clostridiales Family XIII bacterium]|jgi:DNA-binding transcriptional MerR regulator|nr:MerR family transcriptional regulator [Clostridiales Family XIII bacterium]
MDNGLFSISEMASLARVTRDTLIHYDKIGLIQPVLRGKNNYRYYSDKQLALVNIVRTLQSLGMSLKEIDKIARSRTPERILQAFTEQTPEIEKNIEKLLKSHTLLLTLRETIASALSTDEHAVELQQQEAESIFLGPKNDYSGGRSINDALLQFYKYCRKTEDTIDLNYSAWGVFAGARIERGDWQGPDHFYFNNPHAHDEKPAGLYVTAYGRGNYGTGDKIYRRLTRYINENKLTICGPAYEAYPLNEISIQDPDNYLIRVSIRVKQK